MPYSIIRSRAGLVALVLSLIISLVSAAPIPATAPSGLSSSILSPRSLNDSSEVYFGGRMTTLPSATRLTFQQDSSIFDDDDQLVRRKVDIKAGIKKVFHKIADGVKSVVHKVENVAKTVAHKVETAAKTVWHKVGKVALQVVKFGTKIYQGVMTQVGKAVSGIPAFRPLGRVIEGAATAAGAISDRIHVPLPKKLQKGVDIINNVVDKENKYTKFL